MAEMVVINERLTLPLDEIQLSVRTATGPGGQHVNRSRTRVDARFDIEASPTLSERDKARLLDKLGPIARSTAEDERSQRRNRDMAVRRMAEQLRAALHRDPPRRATKPTRGSVERRLDEKKAQSTRKANRRISADD
jgi:ribosome-associated protein